MVDINKTNTEKYLSWLSSEVTSEKYEQFCSAYEEIEGYCFDKKKIKNKLLEIDNIDTVRKVKDIVEKDSIFAFSHKDNKPILVKAILMFYRYIKEKSENISNVLNEKKDFNIEFLDEKDLVFEYMKNIKKAQTIDELQKKFNLGEEQIKRCLKNQESIVLLDEKTQKYMYALGFPILIEEIKEISDFLERYLETNLFIIDLKLTEYINTKMPRLSTIIRDYTRYGWRDCLGYILRNKFSIKNAIISKNEDKITTLDCYSKLCRKRKITNISSLKKLSRALLLPLPFGTILRECIRINNETLVGKDIISFDVLKIDEYLQKICVKDYLAIEDVDNYDIFPDIGIEWNGFVLESYLQEYSKVFKLVNFNFSVETYLGAMVKRNSDISTYDDLIYHVLIDNKDEWTDKDSAMKYIVEHKYRLDTNFANLDDIISKVKNELLEEEKRAKEVEKKQKNFAIEDEAIGIDYETKVNSAICRSALLFTKEIIEEKQNSEVRYVYFGEEHTGFPNISIMYVDFVNTLLEDYDYIISELKNKSIINLIYSLEKEQLMKPKQLKNGIYIDDYSWIMSMRSIDIVDKSEVSQLSIPGMLTNGMCIESDLDANQIIKRIKILMDVCKIERSNVQIYLDEKEVLNNLNQKIKSQSNSEVNSIKDDVDEENKIDQTLVQQNETISQTDEKVPQEKIMIWSELEVEEQFYQWLKEKRGMNRGTFDRFINFFIRKINKFANEHNIYSDNLYSHLNYQEVISIKDTLIKNKVFAKENIQILPLNRYIKFLKEVENGLEIVQSHDEEVEENIEEKGRKEKNIYTELDIEEEFYQWLKEKRGMNRGVFARYTNYFIQRINDFAHKNDIYKKNLYSYTDTEKVKSIKNILINDSKFLKENISLLPLDRYLYFLEDLKKDNEVLDSKSDVNNNFISENKYELDKKFENMKEKFYNWLRNKRNLSESTSKTYVTYGINSIDKIAHENNIYTESLYLYTDLKEVEKIKDKLILNAQFKEENDIAHHTYTATLNNYMLFVNDSYLSENLKAQTEKNTDNIIHETLNSVEYIVDFDSKETYVYTKPIKYILYNEVYDDFKSWSGLYVNFVNVLIGKYPGVIENINNKKINEDAKTLDIADYWNKAALRRPKKLNNGLYLETNLSAYNTLIRINGLLKLCNIDKKDISIYYDKKSSDDADNEKNEITEKVAKNLKNMHENSILQNEKDGRESKFYNILMKYFVKGFRDKSFIELKKLRHYWQVEYQMELTLSDDEIYEELYKVTSCYSSKLFIVDEMLSEKAKRELFTKLDKEFESGTKAIYYNVIYKKNIELFFGSMINNEDMLKFYLSNVNGMKYYADRFYIAKKKGIKLDPLEEIKDYLLNKGIPQKTDDICKSLLHIPENKIVVTLSTNKEFINNGVKEYFHADIVQFTHEEEEIIKNVIYQEIEQYEFTSEKVLMKLLKQKVPSVFERYEYISLSGLRMVIGYKFDDLFSFSGKIISGKHKHLSTNDIYDAYSKTRDVVSMEELKLLRDDLDINLIPLDIIYNNVFRVSQEKFISKDNIEFDVEKVDSIIDKFCIGDYISLNDIVTFGAFPDVGYTWNKFLLEHYVAEYSQKYRLIHTDFNTNTCIGAIVKRSSEISDLHGLIVDIIAKSKISLEENTALNYLYDWGLLGRRTYKNISQALIEAKVEREM
ncbi:MULTISPECIES: hypothetical protein [unclassified Fusobacterium]|uniref:hypothetical protein n=1 Tax=unclassified Fusobacterium TaxID=2648384 RepID=UPI001B8BAE24|nr:MULTISPECIES: hypothetical protein [unclassified Fusobacterium]MBR8701570.1 hypothetical protein [Fusobacterium sp. DD45]MBR8711345.1 hypothetical protein [Fusobacterium sp. DD28]MBR8751894.1 hypothetical protein [Fusobacterium sp. DD26]